jgi:hypothetical protein
MRPLSTLLAAASLGLAAAGLNRALFHRSRRPEPSPEGNSAPLAEGACGALAATTVAATPTDRQTPDSVRWHLERAEARRIRRAYRKMRHDIDSRLDNPAWKHSATGRSA